MTEAIVSKELSWQDTKEYQSRIAVLKKQLQENLELICSTFGFMRSGKAQGITVLKIISSIECEKRLRFTLHHPEILEEHIKFDNIYVEKSNYATKLILDHLKSRLIAEGLSVVILTENRSDFGIYDVVVESGSPARVLIHGVERLKIEIKASLGLPLEQLARYLIDGSTLIVARIVTNHAIALRPKELVGFIEFNLTEMVAKSERVLLRGEDEDFMIPGRYCSGCPIETCNFFKSGRKNGSRSRLITMTNENMQSDLQSFFGNLQEVSNRVAGIVIHEIRQCKEEGNDV